MAQTLNKKPPETVGISHRYLDS